MSPSSPTRPPDLSLAALAPALPVLAASPASSFDTPRPARPLRIYDRRELLFLSSSPLVCSPPGLPSLKDWFGEWDIQAVARKDPDSHQRERRFKRDPDDPEAGARPSFRSTVNATQPSQMGNFKHHSSRVASVSERLDRDREQDKDGHEKLRNLSERYDRERLALTGGPSFRRERDKDSQAANGLAASSSRGDRKEKDGERNKADADDRWRSGSDWRSKASERRAERHRDGRPDQARDDALADHPSRGRRDSSTEDAGRRNASRDSFNRGQSRDARPPARDDDRRKEGGELRSRRNGDQEKPSRRGREEDDNEEGRRWKDDSRWEDKKPPRERDRQRATERDPEPTKRGNLRNKRSSHLEETEKEPAWMEAYDPETDGKLPGILGGQASDGKLDDIQAWKKELKEKELREKERLESTSEEPQSAAPSSQLDEIAVFKMLMQREQGRSSDPPVSKGAPALLSATQPTTTSHTTPGNSSSAGGVIDLSESPGLHDVRNGPSRLKSPASILSMQQEGAPKVQDYDPPRQSRLLSFGLPLAHSNPPVQHIPQSESPGVTAPNTRRESYTPPPSLYRQSRDMDRAIFAEQTVGMSPHRHSPSTLDYSPTSYSHPPYNQGEPFRDPVPEHRHSPMSNDPAGAGGSAVRGSRFAKFFEAKTREPVLQPQLQQGYAPSMSHMETFPAAVGRFPQNEAPRYSNNQPAPDAAFESLLTMLHNSSRNILPPDGLSRAMPSGLGTMEHGMVSPLRESVPQQLLSQHASSRNHQGFGGAMLEPMDQRFPMDNVATGPRLARNRGAVEQYPTEFVDPSQFNMGRVGEQPRAYRTASPETHRNSAQFNGYPSAPITNHALNNPALQARGLPPGLANLGARPPPDLSQLNNTNMAHIANNMLQGMPVGDALVGPRFSSQQQQQRQASVQFQQATFPNPGGGGGGDFGPFTGRPAQAPSPVSAGNFRGQANPMLNQQMMGRAPPLGHHQQQILQGSRNLGGMHPQMVGQTPGQYAGLEGSTNSDLMALLLSGGSRMHP